MSKTDRHIIVSETFADEIARPFQMGESDCFLTACAVVDAIRGTTLKRDNTGCYKDQKTAKRAMKKRGYDSLADFFDQHLERIAPAMAVLGDLVIIQQPGWEQCAICAGGGKFIGKSDRGERQVHRSLDGIIAAWRV